MKTNRKIGLAWLFQAVIAVGAVISITGSTCDETGWGGYGMYGADDGWYYGWTEYGSDGTTRSFSYGPGIGAHDAVQTYLSDSVIYP